MPKMECRFLNIDDCDAVLENDDLFALYVHYFRHLEERHHKFLQDWLETKPISELMKFVDQRLER